MPRNITVPSRTYQAGTRNAETPVDAADTKVDINFTRENWPNVAGLVDAQIHYSNDNGGSWRLLAGATTNGGVLTNRLGQTVTSFNVGAKLPTEDSGSSIRRVRAVLTNTAALDTAITASVS